MALLCGRRALTRCCDRSERTAPQRAAMQVGWKIENGGVFYAGDQVRGYARLKVHKSRKMEEVAVALYVLA